MIVEVRAGDTRARLVGHITVRDAAQLHRGRIWFWRLLPPDGIIPSCCKPSTLNLQLETLSDMSAGEERRWLAFDAGRTPIEVLRRIPGFTENREAPHGKEEAPTDEIGEGEAGQEGEEGHPKTEGAQGG